MSKNTSAFNRKTQNPKVADAKAVTAKSEPRRKPELNKNPNSWYMLCWIVYGFYCYAAFFPDGPLWGIHWMAYIPTGMKILFLIAGGLLLVPKVQEGLYYRIKEFFDARRNGGGMKIAPVVIIAAISFILFHQFTIATNMYGDHTYIVKNYDQNSVFDWNWIGDVLNPELNIDKNLQGYSEALTIGIHRIIAHVFSISIETSYKTVSELCGAVFIFIWILFVQKITRGHGNLLKLILILLGLFCGAMQIFFGHVENYSVGVLSYTIFLMSLYWYLEGKIGTIILVLIYLVAFKTHIFATLFLPALFVALAYRYRNTIPKLQGLFTWRAIIPAVVLPTFLIGLCSYIFLFHSWNEPYAYTTGRQLQQSFLPFTTFPWPLNHYSMWSPYHIADFFNLLFLIAAPILIVLANIIIFHRKNIIWNEPKVIIFGLAVFFPFLFFIALNPQLTPVRDWDMYTLLFPPLLFFTAMLVIQDRMRLHERVWLAPAIVFGALFTIPMVAVNASSAELQERLLDAGNYIYYSYYAASRYIETRAFGMDPDSKPALMHFTSIVDDIFKTRTPGKDPELATMLAFLARFHSHNGNDSVALAWQQKAWMVDTSNQRNTIDLAAYYLQANMLQEATKTVEGFLPSWDRNDTDQFNREELAAVMGQLGARYSQMGSDSLTVFWGTRARNIDPQNLKYTYDLANYYLQSNRPKQALDLFRVIPPDSVSVDVLTRSAIAASYAYGPDSALPYLYKAKTLAPNDRSVDSLILEMKSQ